MCTMILGGSGYLAGHHITSPNIVLHNNVTSLNIVEYSKRMQMDASGKQVISFFFFFIIYLFSAMYNNVFYRICTTYTIMYNNVFYYIRWVRLPLRA